MDTHNPLDSLALILIHKKYLLVIDLLFIANAKVDGLTNWGALYKPRSY